MCDTFSVTIAAQIEATTSYLRLLTAIEECSRLHLEAGIEMPELLRKLVKGEEEDKECNGEDETNLSLFDSIPAPYRKVTPTQAAQDWISLPIPEATPSSIALAILRAHLGPLPASDVAQKVRELLPQTAVNSIYNAMKRLADNGVLLRSPEGFELMRTDMAGVLLDGYLWAPVRHLMPTEVTYHRREAVIQVLQHEPQIQLLRILELLKSLDWVQSKGNKDTLKLDLQALEEKGEVRRVLETRKWEAVKAQEAT
jgi:hypothetical protein